MHQTNLLVCLYQNSRCVVSYHNEDEDEELIEIFGFI